MRWKFAIEHSATAPRWFFRGVAFGKLELAPQAIQSPFRRDISLGILTSTSRHETVFQPSLRERFLKHPQVEIQSAWAPLTRADLYTSHSCDYVNGVLDGVKPNGFGNLLKEVADSLPYTSGSLYHAAVHALKNEVAISPTSGFHHAKYRSGGAFCTFNGLTVAAQLLRRLNKVNRVGIIDFDAHYGNGTADIIEDLKLEYIQHLTYGRHFRLFSNAEAWLKNLSKDLEPFSDCDILLYQAGADPHENDPLGGDLTTEQMRKRDHLVFQFAKDRGIPIVWNLAGGYQQDFEKVLELHENTLLACLEVFQSTSAGSSEPR